MIQITDTNNFIHEVGFHSDIVNLIWYEDCDALLADSRKPSVHFFSLNPYCEEISTIYSNLAVEFPKENEYIEPIHLYGGIKTCSYSELTPLQRGAYIQFLQNPYKMPSDIGFLYLFYEGLERFLLTDRWNDAYKMIMKLRMIYKVTIFQQFSIDALLISAIIHKDCQKAVDLLTKENQLQMQRDLLYYCSYFFNIPIQIDGKKSLITDMVSADAIERLQPKPIVFFQNISLRLTEIKIKMISELL